MTTNAKRAAVERHRGTLEAIAEADHEAISDLSARAESLLRDVEAESA